MQVRAAEDRDVGALCDLYGDFHEFHVRGVPSRLVSLRGAGPAERADLASRLRQIMAVSDSAVFVAEQDDEIVGFAEVYLREDEPSRARVTRRHAHLQSMFVCSVHRRQGIGVALLAACESWARSVGAGEMRLDIWEFPEGPLGFYERSGYSTIRRSLTRELD